VIPSPPFSTSRLWDPPTAFRIFIQIEINIFRIPFLSTSADEMRVPSPHASTPRYPRSFLDSFASVIETLLPERSASCPAADRITGVLLKEAQLSNPPASLASRVSGLPDQGRDTLFFVDTIQPDFVLFRRSQPVQRLMTISKILLDARPLIAPSFPPNRYITRVPPPAPELDDSH